MSTRQPKGTENATSPLLKKEQPYAYVTDKITGIILTPKRLWLWRAAFGFSAAVSVLFFYGIGYLFRVDVGIWGVNIPVAWAFAIANYVWWIGNAMAGTFISAALLLTRQEWRASTSRAAESMTIFCLTIAGLFPILHLGRPWFAYWIAPYPDIMDVWPQWRSALAWDFFAVVSYLIVSLLFWYVGMIPDLASVRDRARNRLVQIFYGFLALGWRGEASHWRRFKLTSGLLAGLAVPLVFSVHSEVGLSFAEGNTPGWHSTIFPPFFVAGALYGGFAMVLMIVVSLRAMYGLEDIITGQDLNSLAKALLAVGFIVIYCYAVEFFMAFYSSDPFEIAVAEHRAVGAYAPVLWGTFLCNVFIPQALWFRWVRLNAAALFFVGATIYIGMWLERFMLIVTSLYEDFLPSAWDMFYPTLWDWIFLFGSNGFFVMLFLLFVRFLPIVSIFEVCKSRYEEKGK
jgi:molybdopterin-containing oxidoreductase family membrane subunit